LERTRRKRRGIINGHRGAPLNKTLGHNNVTLPEGSTLDMLAQ
jgi:hypothetical protein